MTGILGKDKLGSFRLGVSNALKLITDRTQADRDRAEELSLKEYSDLTKEEKAEWDAGLKGAYNAADLNRVENAVEVLAKLLRGLPAELKSYAAVYGVAWDAFLMFPITQPTTPRRSRPTGRPLTFKVPKTWSGICKTLYCSVEPLNTLLPLFRSGWRI